MNKKTLLLAAAVFAFFATVVARAADRRPLRVAQSVDLARYAGKWYEIARFPNRFQKKCASDVTADYTLRPDGKVTVVNRCREADGEVRDAKGLARRADADKSNAVLEVRFAPSFLSFLPFVWGDYQIIALADDYSHAVVGTPDRKYLWVLSRAPRLDDATYRRLAASANEQGFDTNRLVMTKQSGS